MGHDQFGDAYVSDIANPDHDGLGNLVEYAVQFDPKTADFESPPLGGLTSYPDGDRLSMSFMRDPARNDVTIVVEASETLGGAWDALATSIDGAPFTGAGVVRDEAAGNGLVEVEIRDEVPVGDGKPRRFIRLRVFRS